MKASKSRANEARYDQDTEIYVGPPSKVLLLDNVAKSSFLTHSPAVPTYSRKLSSASLVKLAEICSIEDVTSEVHQIMGDKSVVRSLRKRLPEWAEGADCEAGSSQLVSARKSKRIRGNPGKRSVRDESQIEDSVLDDIDFKVPHAFNIFAHPEYATLYYRRDGLLEQNCRDNPEIGSPLHGQNSDLASIDPDMQEKVDVAPSKDKERENALVLTISVYSRHARSLWAKEKVKQEMQRRDVSALDEQDEGSEDHSNLQEEGEESKAERGLYGNLQLSQELDILSIHTLQDLRKAIRCKMDTIPEMQWQSDAKEGMPRLANQKRASDSCFQIEDQLYSEQDSHSSYASLLKENLPHCSSFKYPQREVSIGSIPLCTGKLYWYLHQGNCEHMWTISSIRALHKDDRDVLSTPRTTYCSFATSIQPMIKFSRPKMPVMKQNQLDKCDFCHKRQGKKLIIGGSRVYIAATGIKGLKQEIIVSCDACHAALMGNSADDFTSTNPVQWTTIPFLD